jgi:hypothetical protein
MADEIDRLRAWQIQAAIPHIGPLLDRWEHMSNDVKGSLRSDDGAFCDLMDALEAAWVSEPPSILQSCRDAKRCLHEIAGCICDGDPAA